MSCLLISPSPFFLAFSLSAQRIILHTDSKNKALQQNKNLQNLLILTAIKADKKLVVSAASAAQKAADWIKGERQPPAP